MAEDNSIKEKRGLWESALAAPAKQCQRLKWKKVGETRLKESKQKVTK